MPVKENQVETKMENGTGGYYLGLAAWVWGLAWFSARLVKMKFSKWVEYMHFNN